MILSGVILAILTIHIAMWISLLVGFRRAGSSNPDHTVAIPSTAIIVAVKNEAHNIADLVDCLSNQRHQPDHIIIVDDCSTDLTRDHLQHELDAGRISMVLKTDEAAMGKKNALWLGIEAADAELLIFTDADCRPNIEWTQSILLHVPPETSEYCIIGYSPFDGDRLVGYVSAYETFLTGFLTAATAGLNFPYMAVGRNIAYSRSAFEEVGGFSAIMHSLSGDDDLLVQEFRKNGIPVVHAFGPGSIVRTSAPVSWSRWISQKLRHTSAGKFYSHSTAAGLSIFHLTGLLLYLAPLAGPVGWFALASRITFEWISLSFPARKFDEMRLILAQPILHLLYTLYIVLIAPVGVLRKRTRW